MRRLHTHISRLRTSLLATCLAAFCSLALTTAGVALAQTPTNDAYGGQAGISQGSQGTGPQAAPAAGDSGGGLPFTGLELGAFAAVGAGLVGTGLVLRRTTRSSNQTS